MIRNRMENRIVLRAKRRKRLRGENLRAKKA
jgi:hypothetical protein